MVNPVVFFIAGVLFGRSEGAKRFRQLAVYWLNILPGLMFADC